MERLRIICPATAWLEDIDFERTPAGIVIDGCSAFEPRCAVDCACECARRMDREDRRDVDDRTERVLVVVASKYGRTRAIADAICNVLTNDRLIVDLADADTGAIPPPVDYEAVVIGCPVRSGAQRKAVIDYIVRYRDALAAMPAFVFFTGKRHERDPQVYVDRLQRWTGWRPTESAMFGTNLRARHGAFWGWLARWWDAVRPSDEARDHGLTDWARVREFALHIAEEVPAFGGETPSVATVSP